MKKIISILATLMICFSLSSCVTAAHAQIDDMYDAYDINLVVTYGIPHYNVDGLVLYYFYRDIFYYPFFHNNRYYLRPYRKPLPPSGVRGYRPIPRDYHFGTEPPRRPHDVVPPMRGGENTYRVTPKPNENGNRTYHITPNIKDDKGNVPRKPNEEVKPNANVRPNVTPNQGNSQRQNITLPQRPNTNVTIPTTRSNSNVNSGTRISMPTPNRSVTTPSSPRTSARTMSGRR